MTENPFPRLTKPLAALLAKAGVGDHRELSRTSDEELLAIPGLGAGRLEQLRRHYPFQPDVFGSPDAEPDPGDEPDPDAEPGLPVTGDHVLYTATSGESFDAYVTHPYRGTEGDMLDLRVFTASGGFVGAARFTPFDPAGSPGTWRHANARA